MTLLSSSAGANSLLPAEYGALVDKPVEAISAAMVAGTVIRTANNSYHVPVLDTDVTVGAIAEGAEITPSDAVFREVIVTPRKFAGLSIVSREMADDSNPAVGDQIGRSIARQIAKSVDAALFNALSAPNPAGLAALTGISTVEAPIAYADLDPFSEALSLSESNGGNVDFWVMDATEALDLSNLKDQTGSNRALLNSDLTADGKRQLLGRPILVCPQVPAGTVYGVSKADLLTVVRNDTRVDVDPSAYFSSDRVGVRGTMRVAFGFPVPAAHVRITHAA